MGTEKEKSTTEKHSFGSLKNINGFVFFPIYPTLLAFLFTRPLAPQVATF